jgi:hypothetical protein
MNHSANDREHHRRRARRDATGADHGRIDADVAEFLPGRRRVAFTEDEVVRLTIDLCKRNNVNGPWVALASLVSCTEDIEP